MPAEATADWGFEPALTGGGEGEGREPVGCEAAAVVEGSGAPVEPGAPVGYGVAARPGAALAMAAAAVGSFVSAATMAAAGACV